MENAKQIKEILSRLEKLEIAVFLKKPHDIRPTEERNFSGPKGGILLLLSKGFLNPST